jgi:hypothetical protein
MKQVLLAWLLLTATATSHGQLVGTATRYVHVGPVYVCNPGVQPQPVGWTVRVIRWPWRLGGCAPVTVQGVLREDGKVDLGG